MRITDIAPVSGSAAVSEPDVLSRQISAHGLDNRGLQEAADAAPQPGEAPGQRSGRFGRMFDVKGGGLPDDCLQAIAAAMIKRDSGAPIDVAEAVDENALTPAGYTYFGQFVDHDITLDTTDLKAKQDDGAATEDFRTPALDLDCIYGRGPDDQPYMYEPDGLHLRLGAVLDASTAPGRPKTRNRRDVLRMTSVGDQPVPDGKGPNPAILGDKRNDENRIVCQIQAGMIAFHNKVVDDRALIAAFGGDFDRKASRFATAVDIVRWHYQWLVVNDFLDRVLEPTIVDEILNPGGAPRLPHYEKAGAKYAYMPVEFAGAAYRFGHSMVRPSYALNETTGADIDSPATGDEYTTEQPPHRLRIFGRRGATTNFNGFGFPLPADWGIDWAFFFPELERDGQPDQFKLPQPSYRMDAQLVEPLADLPEFRGETSPFQSLAYRNLRRGNDNLHLPFGEQVAAILNVPVLSPEVLWGVGSQRLFETKPDGRLGQKDDADIQAILGAQDAIEAFEDTRARRKAVFERWVEGDGALNGRTPLWYYVLREAEYYGDTRGGLKDTAPAFGGQFLGPVGSRIIGETFIGLLWNDRQSYLRARPDFQPHPIVIGGAARFTVGQLLKYALAS